MGPRLRQEEATMNHFGFAFNNPSYGDRILRLAVTHPHTRLPLSLKRRRYSSFDAYVVTADHVAETAAVEIEMEEIHVNCALLAKDSMYFRRMFEGDGFKECAAKEIIEISVDPDEKEPFLDMLQYMYTEKLRADTVEGLLRVWAMSERFLVESCCVFCVQRLQGLPWMSLESSCGVLEAASNSIVKEREEMKDIKAKCVAFLCSRFQVALDMDAEVSNIVSNLKDMAKLPTSVLELLLASDDLPVVHEEAVYVAVRVWIETNCAGESEVKEAWRRFGPLIRWPAMEEFRIKKLPRNKGECAELGELLSEARLYRSGTEDGMKTVVQVVAQHNRFRRRNRHALPVDFSQVARGSAPVGIANIFFQIPMKAWEVNRESGSNRMATERFRFGGSVLAWVAESTERGRARLYLVVLEGPPSPWRAGMTVYKWDGAKKGYVKRGGGSYSVSKKEWICVCQDLQILLKDSFYLQTDAWVRTELQTEPT